MQPARAEAAARPPRRVESVTLFQLDRVYVWPREALLGNHTDFEARRISDHLPVIADVRVGV